MSDANGHDEWPAAEANVIGALLLGAPFAEISHIIGAEHFTRADAVLIFRAVAVLASVADHATDVLTVAALLKQTGHLQAAGGEPALSALARNTISPKNAAAHARMVRDHADSLHLRRLVQDTDDSELLEAAQRLVAARAKLEAHAAPQIELRSFTAEQILAPIAPERFLLPGVPAEAYTLIAGALSSFKTTLLVYMLVWKSTGWDILGLDNRGSGIDIGRSVFATYEDTDARILAKLQYVIQHGHRVIRERHSSRDADEFVERAAANIRRIPLMGKTDHGLVRRAAGVIIPNKEFLDRFLEKTHAFAPEGATMGLDPLRLAISGSQNDDDGADVAVHAMNYVASANPGSGLVVCSHSTKAGAQDPGEGYADAAYSTAGSALFSQHARSNYRVARLTDKETRELFDAETVSPDEAKGQLVARLTHGRLSHGPERTPVYLVMRGGNLERVAPKGDQSAAERLASDGRHVIAAIARLREAKQRVSAAALERDSALVKALPRSGLRTALKVLEENGYLMAAGSTSNKEISVTDRGRHLAGSDSGERRREMPEAG
jgi:hypothetical protein